MDEKKKSAEAELYKEHKDSGTEFKTFYEYILTEEDYYSISEEFGYYLFYAEVL